MLSAGGREELVLVAAADRPDLPSLARRNRPKSISSMASWTAAGASRVWRHDSPQWLGSLRCHSPEKKKSLAGPARQLPLPSLLPALFRRRTRRPVIGIHPRNTCRSSSRSVSPPHSSHRLKARPAPSPSNPSLIRPQILHCHHRPELRRRRGSWPSVSPSSILRGGASPTPPRPIPLLIRPLPLPCRAAAAPVRPPPPNAVAPSVRCRSSPAPPPVRHAATSSTPCAPPLPRSGPASPRRLAPPPSSPRVRARVAPRAPRAAACRGRVPTRVKAGAEP